MTYWTTSDIAEAGRVLGHDIHTLSHIPRQTQWPADVRDGFDAASHAGLRRQRADRFVAKCLQLRLNALRRGRIVADDVTPDLLRELDLTHCPVTRQPLTHGTLQDTDWSVDRLHNDAAYAASNLAVMSVKANLAKGALRFEQVHARAQHSKPTDGLSPQAWMRLAALMLGPTFATQPHAAPDLPLCAPLPTRSVRLALQQIQRLFTDQAQRPAGKNRLVREFGSACHSEASRLRLCELAQAVHEGLKRIADPDAPHARWDVWLDPALMHKLLRWKAALDGPAWARAAAIAGWLSAARRETPERLRVWHLPTRGFALDSACFKTPG